MDIVLDSDEKLGEDHFKELRKNQFLGVTHTKLEIGTNSYDTMKNRRDIFCFLQFIIDFFKG